MMRIGLLVAPDTGLSPPSHPFTSAVIAASRFSPGMWEVWRPKWTSSSTF